MDELSRLAPSDLPDRDQDGGWPRRRSATIDWLVNETYGERFLDHLLVECCERLRGAGLPLGRATLHVRIDNPQWRGARMLWRPGLAEAEIDLADYATVESRMHLDSPIRAILEGADEIRGRLDTATEQGDAYPIYDDMRRDGLTDYIAWPLHQTLGKRHVVTFASDRPGGFRDEDVETLADLVPVLALVAEIRLKNRLARTCSKPMSGRTRASTS